MTKAFVDLDSSPKPSTIDINLPAVGEYSEALARALSASYIDSRYTSTGVLPSRLVRPNLVELLFSSKADCKIATAEVAMHIDREWRNRLFSQIDSLLDEEEWDPADKPVTRTSFVTFLRMILFLKVSRRPGLGCTAEGNLIAMWTNRNNVGGKDDRLTLYCLPNDEVRWSVSRWLEDQHETAAGQTKTGRLKRVLDPYEFDQWFKEHG